MKRIHLNYFEVTLTCKGRPLMFTYRSECLFLMTKVGSLARLILCETTSYSTNIYTSLSTSRFEVFYTFLYFIRPLLPPSGNWHFRLLGAGITRGFSKRTDDDKWMSGLYLSFIFLLVLTVVPLFAPISRRRCKHDTPIMFTKLPAGFRMQNCGTFQISLVSVFWIERL
jgi:hypothetical protein